MNWRITWHAVVFRPAILAIINPVSRNAEGYPQSHMHGEIEDVREKIDEMANQLAKIGCKVTLVEIDTVYQPVVPNDAV